MNKLKTKKITGSALNAYKTMHIRKQADKLRKRLIQEEGYDPRYMYDVLKKTPTPTAEEWSKRVEKAAKNVNNATSASFLDKYRLVKN